MKQELFDAAKKYQPQLHRATYVVAIQRLVTVLTYTDDLPLKDTIAFPSGSILTTRSTGSVIGLEVGIGLESQFL